MPQQRLKRGTLNDKLAVANQYFAKKNYLAALMAYDEVIASDPEHVTSYLNKGNVYARLGRYLDALVCYQTVIGIDKQHKFGYYNSGFAYMQSQQYTKAIASYTEAINIDVTFVEAYLSRGNVYMKLEQYEHAKKDYDRVIALLPNRHWQAYYNRAIVRRALGFTQGAQADLVQAELVAGAK